MGRTFSEIDDKLAAWIDRQHMLFVATAPTATDGHVNVSPKGLRGTFRIFDSHSVGYVDLFGSGIETVAHLKDNGRIVVMFCAFEGPPRVVRLHGHGEVVEQGAPEFPELLGEFDVPPDALPAVRAIVRIEVTRIADSCGFTVPVMTFARERDQLLETARAWMAKDGPDAIRDYCDINNVRSIDGLQALEPFVGEPELDRPRAARSHEGRAL